MPENGVNTEGSKFVDGVDNVDNLEKKGVRCVAKTGNMQKKKYRGKIRFPQGRKEISTGGAAFPSP